MTASYSGVLTSSSSIYYRPNGESSRYYYYLAIKMTTSISGRYVFTSSSGIDTVGYLYLDSFDPSKPTLNLLNDDDDSGDIVQFRMQAYLNPGRTYILVVTTHRPHDVGRFSLQTTGPSTVTLSSYYPSTSQPIITRKLSIG